MNSIMNNSFSILIWLTMLMIGNIATAQNRWSIELQTSGAFATQNLADADLGIGFGLEGTLAYRFMPHLSAYAGWGWSRFGSDQSFAGPNMDFEETGYTVGLQFMHPLGNSRLSYYVGAGGVYNHIECENSSGDIIGDTGHGFGWQADAGIAFPLGSSWRLLPSIRYRSLSRDFELGATTTPVDLTYVGLQVGIARTF